MDKLSRFPNEGISLDSVTEDIEKVATGIGDVLKQLKATHLGHEEELWGKEIGLEESFEAGIDEDAEEFVSGDE